MLPKNYMTYFPAEEEFVLGSQEQLAYEGIQQGSAAYASFRIGWNNHLSGRIFDSEGNPIVRAKVAVLLAHDPSPLVIERDEYDHHPEGKFQFYGLTPRRYILSVNIRAPFADKNKPTCFYYPNTDALNAITARHTTSSSEYISNQIKRHKLGVITTVVGLIGLVILGVLAYSRYLAAGDKIRIASLAVLPFANDTGDAQMEYLSDGLSESLINNLSQVPRLKVIARSSAFRYKGKEVNPEEVAQALGVKSILTGRVLRYGENLQISVELMDARDKTQVWGAQYNRSGSDLMAVQQEIAREISRNLRLRLSPAEQSRVGNMHTENSEAYELYLKGRFYWNKRTGESLEKSVDYFNQAIEKDPSYALAYVGLADAYIVIPFFSVGSAQDSYPKARAAARRALEIDETLAEAHTAMAAVLMDYDWNLAESNREFERAIELNPNYANAHHWYARENLTITGEFDKALAEMRRAQELDPLSLIINANFGKAYFNARRYDEAIQQLSKTIEIDPSFFVAHHYLGSAYAMKGAFSEALAEYQKAHQLNEYDPHVVALTARLYAVTGKRTEALTTLSAAEGDGSTALCG